MLFGVASAPAIWQRTIDQILQGLTGVQCILDDMVITGKNDREHLVNLEKVMKRLEMYNLSVNKEKCKFFKDEIEFCGHKIDKHGLHKTEDKIKAILDTPEPQNVTQVRSILGLMNYYHKFLPNISSVVRPLHRLLEKDAKWDWNEECKVSFKRAKDLVTSEQVLCHYDPELPIRLACDASPFGLGVVLSHKMQDGTERPIAFASRSLNKAERNYSQIDKEALVDIHMTFEYKNTNKHTNADALSRIPQESTEADGEEFDAVDVFMLKQLEHLSLTNNNIRRETARDKILSRVYELVQKGWTVNDDIDLKPYFNRKKRTVNSVKVVCSGEYVLLFRQNLDSKL
ncbi:Hypothetical predicted protein [Mytilus galloprovincialis]|uniref:Reverse transcriptase domain-containing protein n=1 Tax=Mytilus galloprovincialis TaxID=29158 RepID=A0A8B6E0R9_MYTGA|nr:Hypothetical predicted protein [Mytilus galloprovincialis]